MLSLSLWRKTLQTTAPNKRRRRRIHNRKPTPIAAAASQTPAISLGDKIPDELTLEILRRLPAKSLLRFKAVSRPWQNLVTNDPSFIRDHKLSRESMSPRRYCISGDDDDTLTLLRVAGNSLPYNFDFITMDGVPDAFQYHSRVVGYCDGLFCVYYRNDDVLIWNPATRETWPLPPSINYRSNFYSRLSSLGCFSYGFGFDSSSRDYKVIRVVLMLEVDGDGNATYRVEVCNAKAGSNWRELVPSPLLSKCRHELDALRHRGKCYFMTKKSEDSLVVFDLAEETFQLLPLPFACPLEDPTHHHNNWYRVIELNGGVGLVSYVNSITKPNCFDLWMMNDSLSLGDGAGQVSWSRYTTVQIFSKSFTVLFVTEKCEILIRDHKTGRLNLQDVRTGQVLDLQRRVWSQRVFAYSDSLVSLKGKD